MTAYEPRIRMKNGVMFFDINNNGELNQLNDRDVNSDDKISIKETNVELEPFALRRENFDPINRTTPEEKKAKQIEFYDDNDRLTLGELVRFFKLPKAERDFNDLFDYEVSGKATVGLKLETSFLGSTKLPKIKGDLLAELPIFNYNNQETAANEGFNLELNNLQADMGTLITGLLKDVFKPLDPIVEKTKPIIKLFTADIKVPSLLGIESTFEQDGRPGTTILELASALAKLSDSNTAKKVQSAVKWIKAVVDIFEIIDSINEFLKTGDSLIVNIGSYNLTDLKGASKDPELSTAKTPTSGNNSQLQTTTQANPTPTNNSKSGSLLNKVKNLDGLNFPLLNNPTTWVKLLMGEKAVDLVTYDVPDLDFGVKFELPFVLWTPPTIKATFGGELNAKSNLFVGFDTYGLQKAQETGDWWRFFDGFYIRDAVNGDDQPEFTVDGQIYAKLALSALVVQANIQGGIQGKATLDLVDVGENNGTSDGKVRGSEIIERLSNPLELFRLAGTIDAFLKAQIKVGLDLGFFEIMKTVYEKEFARETLFQFSVGGGQPPTIGGRFSQSYISGGLVFFDTNFNYIRDEEEAYAITNEDGSYELDIPYDKFDLNGNAILDPNEGRLVATGGIDSTSGLPIIIPMLATPNSRIITPLTTLKAILIEQGDPEEVADNKVKKALGLPEDIVLETYDSIANIQAGNVENGTLVYQGHVLLQGLSNQAYTFLKEATGLDNNDVLKAALMVVAAAITNESIKFDFAKPEKLKGIFSKLLESALKIAPATVIDNKRLLELQQQIDDLVKDIANSNQILENAVIEAKSKYQLTSDDVTSDHAKFLASSENGSLPEDLSNQSNLAQELLLDIAKAKSIVQAEMTGVIKDQISGKSNIVAPEIPTQSGEEDKLLNLDLREYFNFDLFENKEAVKFSVFGLPDRLSIDAKTGIISGIPNRTDVGEYTVTIEAFDVNSLRNIKQTAQLKLQVAAINQPPTLANFSKLGQENTEFFFTAADFTDQFNDIDKDKLTKIQILSLPQYGTLKLDGAQVQVGQEIDIAALQTGNRLSFTPEAKFSGIISFNWNASDGKVYAKLPAKAELKVQPATLVNINLVEQGTTEVLQLTSQAGDVGNAFYDEKPISLAENDKFSSSFQLQVNDPEAIAKGIVFSIVAQLGDGEGDSGMGYAGVKNSIGIEFDFSNDGEVDNDSSNHIAINVNGEIQAHKELFKALPTTIVDAQGNKLDKRLNNGKIWQVWVDYVGETDTLEVRLSDTNTRPQTADLTYTGVREALGTNKGYLGFSGSSSTFNAVPLELPQLSESTVAWGDEDGDGDLDFAIAGNHEGDRITRVYRNDGNNTFTDIKPTLAGVDAGSLAWGDYNKDGQFTENQEADLVGVDNGSLTWGDFDNYLAEEDSVDLLVTGKYQDGSNLTQLYSNIFNGEFVRNRITLPEIDNGDAAWGDYDRDGKQDLLLTGTTASGKAVTQLYRNFIGAKAEQEILDWKVEGQFSTKENRFTPINIQIPEVTEVASAWGDYDRDGDLDFVLTGNSSGERISQIFQNNNGNFTNIASLEGVESGAVAWGDYDGDGDLDLALTGKDNNNAYITKIYRNHQGSFEDTKVDLPGVAFGAIAWGD